MRFGGQPLREHVRLLAPMLGALTSVWALRWIAGSAGAPLWLIRAVSLTGAAPIAVALTVLLVHLRRVGGYASVGLASLVLNAWTQALICLAIVVSVATGVPNVYTYPEFSMPGEDPLHLRHIYGHLTFGLGISTLIGAAVGALLLFLLRRLVPLSGRTGER